MQSGGLCASPVACTNTRSIKMKVASSAQGTQREITEEVTVEWVLQDEDEFTCQSREEHSRRRNGRCEASEA